MLKPSNSIKPVYWVGASYKDFCTFPEMVQHVMGFALYQAQKGRLHGGAKPLKGFGGASVIEIVDDYQGDTYRAVYTVRFGGAIYVLHAFQKKSKHGIKTPQAETDVVRRRLKAAEEDHKAKPGAANE